MSVFAGSRAGNHSLSPKQTAQHLQGLDDRRNQLIGAMNKGPPSKGHAPISNTLLELQQRQVVHNTVAGMREPGLPGHQTLTEDRLKRTVF